jgi:hypothetical protein
MAHLGKAWQLRSRPARRRGQACLKSGRLLLARALFGGGALLLGRILGARLSKRTRVNLAPTCLAITFAHESSPQGM